MRWYRSFRIIFSNWYTALMRAMGLKLERIEGSPFLYNNTTFACTMDPVGLISPERRPLMRARRSAFTEIGANLRSSAGTLSGPQAFLEAIRPSTRLKNLQETGCRILAPSGIVR